MTKHYKYGGSTAARTIACPSWVQEAARAPEQQESEYAAEGTMLHDAAEQVLLEASYDHDLDEDQKERLNLAISAWDDLCREYKIQDYDPEITIEMNKDIGGTCDIVGWNGDSLVVADFKFGQGIEVEAKGNAQLLFYAMLAELRYGSVSTKNTMGGRTKLVVAIIQPIPSRDTETLKVWEVPLDVFELFKQTFMKAVNNTGLNSGEHCRWCPAAPYCRERTGAARAALMADPTQAKELSDNLKMALELESWIGEVKKQAHEQLELGTKIEGFKLVPKRATRKWKHDDEVIINRLRKEKGIRKKDIVKEQVLSPAQVGKLFKSKGIDFDKVGDYISKTSTGTTLAPEDDPRDEVMSTEALKAALKRL